MGGREPDSFDTFNGGRETPFPGEDRIIVPSPEVATYDMQPEMSAPKVASELIDAIERDAYDFIITNFANTDMVGHTARQEPVIRAVETITSRAGTRPRPSARGTRRWEITAFRIEASCRRTCFC